jgi:hypothetical protein
VERASTSWSRPAWRESGRRRDGKPTWFQRFLLPGLAFKAVVIGGGYATGRELAEFFLPSGPRGGVLGMLLAMLIWSCRVRADLHVRAGDRRVRLPQFLSAPARPGLGGVRGGPTSCSWC